MRRLLALLRRAVSLERHFLPLLFCALVLPSIAVVLLAVLSMVSQERAMEAAVSSYVQDLAESIAYRFFPELPLPSLFSFSERQHHSMRFPFFSWGPSIPGWVAYLSPSKKIIMSSPGSPDAQNIAAIFNPDLPTGKAVRVKDQEGKQYTLAIYPFENREGYVVAAVSWDQLLGGLVTVGRMWPALIVLMALGSFLAIRLLWNRLVQPLKSMVAEIGSLRVGRDVPSDIERGVIKEIKSLHGALTRFASAAVERDTLRNSYVRDIIQAQENERTDMAREIHDGPLQDITALLQQIHMSRLALDDEKNTGESKSPDERAERLRRTESLAKTVVRELRGLCDELSPPWMDLGLEETLTEMAERMAQSYDIDIDVSVETELDENAGREVTVSFMRIFQEAVSNAVRHGGATEVHARVHEDGNQNSNSAIQNSLILEISDNGQGFDTQNLNHEKLRLEGHRGLANMTERMSLMGGSLSVKSQIGKGTRVIAVLPRK